MTPFDPAALLAVLLAFYQPASPANLARAFQERPEYFGGGQLIGSLQTDLELPDGTVWDLIFSAHDPTNARYQTIIPSGGGDAGGDPLFTLTPGALSPAPHGVLPLHKAGDVFVPIVAAAMGDVDAGDAAIGARASDLASANTLSDAVAGGGGDVDAAGVALNEQLGAIDGAAPGDVFYNTDQHGATIPGRAATYDELAPGYADTDTRPAPPPDDDGSGPGNKPPGGPLAPVPAP